MKKKILSIAAIVICLSILTGGTLAYRTVADTARNVITSNGVAVELVDSSNKTIQVMPSQKVSKVVSARNLDATSWVRMRYTMTVLDAAGTIRNLSQADLAKIILVNTDKENWTEKDGWFYYNTAVHKDETTKPLFTEVTFSGPNMDNTYQQNTLKIHVEVQAVQKANNGTNVMDAAGWPEET